MKFQYGYVFLTITVWSSNSGKIIFWSLYLKKLLFVPKIRRLNLISIMHWNLLFGFFFSIFRIFVIGTLNDPQ